MIQTRNLSRSYRVHVKSPGLLASLRALFVRNTVERHALRSINLDVAEGEILGLLGANGAGKTTLVKILAGIIHPGEGEVRVLGHRPFDRSNDFRRQIALIMGQKAQLWWDLPAADCFLLLKEIYRLSEKEYRTSLDRLAGALQVDHLLTTQIRRLSLGERMKMELVAALLHRPRVVFLDEPTIGLDLGSQRAIRNFILEYRREHQPAMILTSHYMEDIERLCERIVILREGEVIYDGSLDRIMRDYAKHKILSARLKNVARSKKSALPKRLGDTLLDEPGFLRLRINRDRAAEAASFVLKNYPVIDLNIEEQEVGTIIDSIQRLGTGVTPV